MSEFDDLAKEYNLDANDPSLAVKNTGTGGAYEFPEGEYSVLFGDFHLKYKNKENKTCKKDDPGATLAFGMQDFIILKDPNKMLVDNKYNLVPDEDIRAYMYKQYITLKSDDQWQNKKVYSSCFVENVPQFDVIQNKDKQDFVIRLGVVKMYYGAPAKLILKPYKGKMYLDSVELSSHEISKEKLAKRKTLADNLYQQVDAKWNEYKAKKASEKKAEDNGVVEDVAEAGDIIDEFDLEG